MIPLPAAVADRIRGAFLGLAGGDAVGTTLEFTAPGSFEPLTDMVGGGPFRLPPGGWTDDTSMAACLAESLVETGAFDPVDQLERYLRWYRDGHWSVKGFCFDIGGTTRAALRHFETYRDPARCGGRSEQSAGNGSIMRLAAVPLAYLPTPAEAIRLAGESSRTTHATPAAVDACRYLAGILIGAASGVPKAELLTEGFAPAGALPTGAWPEGALMPAIAEVAGGSFLRKSPPAIQGSGYVVESLEAALWAFATTDSFEACVLSAANLGRDADTTAAVAGQIAGAHYGLAGIPERWLARLVWGDRLRALADGVVAFAERHPTNSPPNEVGAQ